MSKLIKKLRQISENAAPPMGFRPAPVASRQQMLLIACLPHGNADTIAQLAKADADAILIRGQSIPGDQALREITDSAGDIPWGLHLDALNTEGLEQFKGTGADFLVFEASATPATLLQEEEVGKVLKVDPGQDEGLIASIDELPIEAMLLNLNTEAEVLTIADLMYCQWLSTLVDKPLLVAVQREPTDKEIQSLCEVGVRGLVVDLSEKQLRQSLAALSQAIRALPTKTRKPSAKKAMPPSIGYGHGEPPEDLDDL